MCCDDCAPDNCAYCKQTCDRLHATCVPCGCMLHYHMLKGNILFIVHMTMLVLYITSFDILKNFLSRSWNGQR